MKVNLVLFLSVILMVSKVIYGESSGEDDQITTTIQPEAIPEDNVQEKSAVSYNNNNKTSTSLPSLIGNIVTHLGKQTKSLFLQLIMNTKISLYIKYIPT